MNQTTAIDTATADDNDQPSWASMPPRWRAVRLGDVVTLQRGKDLPEGNRTPGPYPVIGSNGIVGYHIEAVAQGPGILVGRSGSVGKVTWIDSDYWPLNTTLWASDFHGNEPEYILFLLSHMNLADYAAGVSVPTLNRNLLHPVTVDLPPLPEQRAIARVLRAVQDAVAARRRGVALERERKAALMHHLFTHGTRGEPTKQIEIGEMPESWRVVRLGDAIARTQYGLSLRGETSGQYPILRMNNLVDRHINVGDLQYVELDDATLRQFGLAQGDILFNRTNSYELVGKTALFDLPGIFVFASYLIRVVTNPRVLLPGFLSAYFNAGSTQHRLKMLASRGVSQSNISASKLQSFPISLPTIDEQRTIAGILDSCDVHIAALEREITLHEELFRALLEELMTGRLSALPLAEENTVGVSAEYQPAATEGAAS